MTDDSLVHAQALAGSFMIAVKELSKRRETEPSAGRITGCKESAAVRRASMDLTRALAELRKFS